MGDCDWDHWVTCECEEKELKLSRGKSEENDELELEHTYSELSNTFEWLDGIKRDDSIVVPLGVDEEFCCGNEEIVVESNIEEDVFHLELDEEETIDLEAEDEVNGMLLPLFISHILCCKPYKNYFQLGSLVFKTVKIFGTIVATQLTNNKNTVLVDDGTAEIMCYMEDSVNYDDRCDTILCGNYVTDSPYYEFSEYFRRRMKEYEYTLPTFDKINIGDLVCIEGNVSLHKNNYYIFVNLLHRPIGNSDYISFVDEIFQAYESSYYDFGSLESNLNR